ATTFVVTGLNTGTVTGVAAGFADVENLTGGSLADTFQLSGGTLTGSIDGAGNIDTLIGDDLATAFVVTGLNTGTVTGVAAGFADVENLTGGALDDTFQLSGGTLTGSIDGAGDIDTLIADNLATTLVVTGLNTGTVTGVGAGFTNVENLTGGSLADTFQLSGGTLTGSIDGAGNIDTLLGDDLVTTFDVIGPNAGTVTGVGAGFTNVENLTGGSLDDTFQAATGATLTGVMDGGDGNDQFFLIPDPFVTFRAVGNGEVFGDVLSVMGQSALPINDGLVITTSEFATIEHSGFESITLICALCAPVPALIARSEPAPLIDSQSADSVFVDWREEEPRDKVDDPLTPELDRAMELLGDALALTKVRRELDVNTSETDPHGEGQNRGKPNVFIA
ncbi:MAG: hypothetical protein P8N76_07035, partial [Pirellulaceae bacterium]|nr:hypothetical protein [Pirellulaceae bacterium]